MEEVCGECRKTVESVYDHPQWCKTGKAQWEAMMASSPRMTEENIRFQKVLANPLWRYQLGCNASGQCEECSITVKEIWDHAEWCQTGEEAKRLWSHDDLYDCLKEFENFMGDCPTHGKPDYPFAMSELVRWKDRLDAAKQLLLEAIHDVPMGSDWTNKCKLWILDE